MLATRRVRASALALVAWSLFEAGPARAQAAGDADVLYDRGLAEMQAGRYANGCPLLAESYRLDPQPGALFTEAECEAKWGRIASALAHYEEYLVVYARLPESEQRAQQARQSAAIAQKIALGPQVPHLTVRLATSAPKETIVERDGRLVDRSQLGAPVPVDPGEHVVIARAPGRAEQRQSVVLSAGETKQVELAVAPPTAALPAATTPKPVERPVSHGGLAYVVGAVGIAGLAAGGITAGLAASKKATIDDNCDGRFCNQDGLDAATAAQSFATASNISFGVGLVGVAASAVLLLTEPSSSKLGRVGLAGGPTPLGTALRSAW